MWFLELPPDIYHKELLMFNYDIDKKYPGHMQWTEPCSLLLSPAVSCSLAPWNTLTSHRLRSESAEQMWQSLSSHGVVWWTQEGNSVGALERPRCGCWGGMNTLLRVIFPPSLLLLLHPSSHLPPLPFSPQDKQHHPWLSPEASLLEKRDKFLSLSPLPT